MSRRYTRREYLTGIGAAATTLTLSPTVPTSVTGFSLPDDAVMHSRDRPSWIVGVDDEATLEALEDYADPDEDRYDLDIVDRSVQVDDEGGSLTVIASPGDMGVRQRDRFRGDGLLTHVDGLEYVELNRTVSLADPITPEGVSAWDHPGGVLASVFGFGDLSSTPDAVAFDRDMDETSLLESRRMMDATDSDLDGLPDTSDLTIAVVDTGVNDDDIFRYEDDDETVSRLLETSKDYTTTDAPTGRDAVADGDGHGSWIASCYAADPDDDRYKGFCPDARILGVKALGDDGQGTLADIESAIRYAADEGADVIQLSLGSPQFSEAIHDALEYAVSEGSIPVAAAGNDRQVTRWVATPASSEYAIAVGATTVDDPEDAKSAYFSNVGPHNGVTDDSAGKTADEDWGEIDVAAPGTETAALTPADRGATSADALSGTSMASPKAGAVIALYLAENPGEEYADVRDRLRETAQPIPNAAPEEVGHGMPTAKAMLQGDDPDDSQADAATDEALTRGEAYRSLSDATGGTVTRYLL